MVKQQRSRRFDGSVRLEEVARLAGVSTASVSRVLNRLAVTDGTRRRVEDACAQLGYVPNGAARALSSRRTRAVGAVVPSIENAGFSNAIASLQGKLAEHGYTLLLASSGYDPKTEFESVNALIAQGVDAIVLVGDRHDARLIPMLDRHGVVYVQTWTLTPGRPYVGFNNAEAAGQVVEHLLELGHKRVAMISGRARYNDRAAARVEGVNRILAASNLALHTHVEVDHPFRIADGRMAARSILSGSSHPTALICSNDQLAFGAMIEAAAQGILIPEHLSVTGFNDLDYAAFLYPPLTTVQVNAEEIGARAGDYVIRKLAGETPLLAWEIDVSLIVRRSTAVPRDALTAKASQPSQDQSGQAAEDGIECSLHRP